MKADLQKVEMPLLENGLDFILNGLNNLKKMDKNPSCGKYAILHIHAGMELILKERLRQEHWSLIFAKDPNRKAYDAGDFVSVYMDNCILKLRTVCGIDIPDNDEKILKNLRATRNKIEHFNAEYNIHALASIVAKSLAVLVDFITENFDEDDFSENEADLLSAIRKSMGEIDKIVDTRMKQISLNLKKYNNIAGCPSCRQKTAVVNAGFKCLFCGFEMADSEQAADAYLEGYMNLSEYRIVKEGGEWPVYECMNCGAEAMVLNEDDKYSCFECGATYDCQEITECMECGKKILYDEDGIDLCQDCIDYKLDKND